MGNSVRSIWENEQKRILGFTHSISSLIKEYAILLELGKEKEAKIIMYHIEALLKTIEISDEFEYLKRFFEIFIDAINRRHQNEVGNLYLEDKMLQAFDTFYHSVPFVKFGHDAANSFINAYTIHETEITIIDIGFGSGLQWKDFLEKNPKKINLIAIDLPTENNFQKFEEFLQNLKRSNVSFTSVLSRVEELDFLKLPLNSSFLVINASFSLHHILPDEFDSKAGRQHLLREISKLKPDLFILVEPDSNHSNLSPAATIIEVMAHYMSVFHALDYFLKENENLMIIEREFFGREMRNILGNFDTSRYERHERYEQWILRLKELNLREVEKVTYTWKTKPLIVASAWQPIEYFKKPTVLELN